MVPATMTEEMWKEITFSKTVQERLDLYSYFAEKENDRNLRDTRKMARNAEKRWLLQKKLRENFGNLLFNIFRLNSIFLQ